MKKLFVALFLAAVTCAVSAAPVKLTWILNTWTGYKPYVKMTKAKDGTYTFTKSTAKYGFGLRSAEYLPAKAGDTVKFTAQVKGKGKFFLQLQNYDAKRRWITIQTTSQQKAISADWKEITLTGKVTDLKGKAPTAFIRVSSGAGKGDLLQMRNPRAEVIPAAK